MSLTATVSRNPALIYTYEGNTPIFPLLAGSVINQGDIVCWDIGSGLGVRAVVTQADMAYYVGIALQANPLNSLGDQMTSMQVQRNGMVWMYSTAADAIVPLANCYFNETVSVQTTTIGTNAGARTKPVGIYFPEGQQLVRGGGAAQLDITGAAGLLIPVWLTAAYPINPNGSTID